MATAIPSAMLCMLFSVGTGLGDGAGVMAAITVSFAALLWGLALAAGNSERTSMLVPVLSFFAWVAFVCGAFPMTFSDFNEHSCRQDHWDWSDRALAAAAWLAAFIPAVAFTVWGIIGRLRNGRGLAGLNWLLPLLALLSVWTILPGIGGSADIPITVAYNLVLLATAAKLMADGCRLPDWRAALFGCLLLAALVMARYFDLFHNLLIRGLMFLLVGAAVFAEGLFYLKAKLKPTSNENAEGAK